MYNTFIIINKATGQVLRYNSQYTTAAISFRSDLVALEYLESENLNAEDFEIVFCDILTRDQLEYQKRQKQLRQNNG
jgi:hypothetical protein